MKRKLRSLLSLALALLLAAALTLPASAAMWIEHNVTPPNEHRNLTGGNNSYLRSSAETLGSRLRLNMQDDSTTRGEGVRALAIASLGVEEAEALPLPETAPFDDVPVDDPDAKYIEYCKKEGIIDGHGNGLFDPDGELTSTAYSKMLLGALGYDSAREGYVGTEWKTNVTRTALEIGLFVVVDDDGRLDDRSHEPLSPSSGNITSDDSGIRHGVLDPDEFAQLIKDYIAADKAVSGSDAVGLLVTASTLPRSSYDDPSSSFGFGDNGLRTIKTRDEFGRPVIECLLNGEVIYSLPLESATVKHLAVANISDKNGALTLSGRWITDDDIELKRDGETVTLKDTYTAYPWASGVAVPEAAFSVPASPVSSLLDEPLTDEDGSPLIDDNGSRLYALTLEPTDLQAMAREPVDLSEFFAEHPNTAGWIYVATLFYDEDSAAVQLVIYEQPIAYPLTGSSDAPSIAPPSPDGCCSIENDFADCTCEDVHFPTEESDLQYCGHEDCWCYLELFPEEFEG